MVYYCFFLVAPNRAVPIYSNGEFGLWCLYVTTVCYKIIKTVSHQKSGKTQKADKMNQHAPFLGNYSSASFR